MTYRVLVADDNAIVRSGIVALLAPVADVEVVAEAVNGRDACDQAADAAIDVCLLDVRMPVMDGIQAARHLAGSTRVLMLTYSDDEELVTAAIRAGAAGYLVHGTFATAQLADAIRRVGSGGSVLSADLTGTLFAAVRSEPAAPAAPQRPHLATRLTEREAEVMDLVAQGLRNSEIAEALVVAPKTVKNHVNHIYGKLGVRTRAAAIAAWLGTASTEPDRHRMTP